MILSLEFLPRRKSRSLRVIVIVNPISKTREFRSNGSRSSRHGSTRILHYFHHLLLPEHQILLTLADFFLHPDIIHKSTVAFNPLRLYLILS